MGSVHGFMIDPARWGHRAYTISVDPVTPPGVCEADDG